MDDDDDDDNGGGLRQRVEALEDKMEHVEDIARVLAILNYSVLPRECLADSAYIRRFLAS